MTTPTPQARPSVQDVERVLAEVLERHVYLRGLGLCRCGWDGNEAYCGSDDRHRAHVAAEQAAALRALPTGDEALAKAWDEGFRQACSDHRGYSSCATGDHGQQHANPYLTTPPAPTEQTPNEETR